MAALVGNLVASLPFALPRMWQTARLGGGVPVLHWDAGGLALASLWGGFAPAAVALSRREPWLAVKAFAAGWLAALAGRAFWDPHPWLVNLLQELVELLGLRSFGHPMFWLNRVVRLTEAPVSAVLVALVVGLLARAPLQRVLTGAGLCVLPLPVLWIGAAVLERVVQLRVELLQIFSLFLLLGHFALWGGLPWLSFRRGRQPAAPGEPEPASVESPT